MRVFEKVLHLNYSHMENPIHWRLREIRLGFRCRVLDEAPDYRIVEIGSGMHFISKMGEKGFMIPKDGGPLYPRRNGHSNAENHPLNCKIIYQREQKFTLK